MADIDKNIKVYNPNKKQEILIVFDDLTDGMLGNKKLNPIVTESCIRGRKLNISLVFITQSFFPVPKNIRLNSKHYFVIKNPDKRQRQHIAFNHSSNIDFQNFMNLYKKYTAKPYWLSRLYKSLQIMHYKTIYFFSYWCCSCIR